MEDAEQTDEAAENNAIDEIIVETHEQGSPSEAFRPRRSSILKKSNDRPVAKSVSFSSIPGEKKVTNGTKYRLLSSLKYT